MTEPCSRYYPVIFLQIMKNPRKTSFRKIDAPADIRTELLRNTNIELPAASTRSVSTIHPQEQETCC
jgi:hypothetical protein